MASPIPIEAPVITATLPDNEADAESKDAMRVCNLTSLSSQGGVESSKPARAEDGRVLHDLMSSLLPLFPLDLVLLPAVPLPLHVFEPRYKEMINECLTQNRHFGIVRSKEEALASIGCTAEIINVMKTYPDGRMDILTEGKRRFEVLELNQERSFLQAAVIYLDDENEPAPGPDLETALRLHGEIMELAGAQPEDAQKTDSSQLAYRLAGSLPFDPDFQQTLLEMNSEADRIRSIIAFFERILPTLQQSARARRKAGGNGHVH
jgi:Lon protease-like protein